MVNGILEENHGQISIEKTGQIGTVVLLELP